MLQIENKTPFAANINLMPNPQGIDTLYVIVKASFQVGRQWQLLDEQIPPQQADEYLDEPGQSSCMAVSDFLPKKPTTDIVVLGDAFSADEQPTRVLDVGMRVGDVAKQIKVFGERVWDGDVVSTPEPFSTMPMSYEYAFGGKITQDGVITEAFEGNPAGRGYLGKRDKRTLDGQPLPNLEDPQHLIQNKSDQPPPANFGFVAPNWYPRSQFAGTYDDLWSATRAPYLPEDFDPRFFNCASHGLVCPTYLQGNERVLINGMHPRGNIQFSLLPINLRCRVQMEAGTVEAKFDLETLVLYPNDVQVSMVWKAALPCDKTQLTVKNVIVSLIR